MAGPNQTDTTGVPTYSAEGRRLGNSSHSRVERLLSLSLIVSRRNRKGKIVCVQFRDSSGGSPLRNTAHLGQKYSWQERLDGTHYRAWRHAPQLAQSDPEKDAFVRSVFLAVPLSVSARGPRAFLCPKTN